MSHAFNHNLKGLKVGKVGTVPSFFMAKVFLNGEIVDAADAKVSAKDSGLLYGAGLFETMRCTAGKVFALDDHLERLCRGHCCRPVVSESQGQLQDYRYF